MSKKLTNFRIDAELLDGLGRIRDREGVPVSEQVRRAIASWLQEKGERVTSATKRADRRPVGSRSKRS